MTTPRAVAQYGLALFAIPTVAGDHVHAQSTRPQRLR